MLKSFVQFLLNNLIYKYIGSGFVTLVYIYIVKENYILSVARLTMLCLLNNKVFNVSILI